VLDGSVPPINVLIVEDNPINLRILEGLMKRLKVRWHAAANGQIAVDMWRKGGYHLVLMDIQMPVMNGLQATKEIRRLERVNGIGIFSSTPTAEEAEGGGGEEEGAGGGQGREGDVLVGLKEEGLFKSPVIIVALTASSLQSDRHEALAAGCNDFLTKPVNFMWLERKVKEWGCMQALIDFDGWRRWKEFASKEEEGKTAEQREKERVEEEKAKKRAEKMVCPYLFRVQVVY
jgi:osomolarity two-component system, response regulator SSK1